MISQFFYFCEFPVLNCLRNLLPLDGHTAALQWIPGHGSVASCEKVEFPDYVSAK